MGGGRKISVDALFSDAAPGIALHAGQWLDLEGSKGKSQVDTASGWRPYTVDNGAACGPIFYDLEKASAYAISVAALTDWNTVGKLVPAPLYAKLMRLWYPAAGKKLTKAMRAELAQMEGETETAVTA